MTAGTDVRSMTTADELPPYGLLCMRLSSNALTEQPPLLTYVVGGGLVRAIEGTPTAPSRWHQALEFFVDVVATSTVSSFVSPMDEDDHPIPSSAARVRSLHRRSGLTWEQLARAFGVSRRAIHAWARGGRMNARNAERLGRIEEVVAENEDYSAELTREALLRPTPAGVSPLQALLRTAHGQPPSADLIAILTSSGEGPNIPGNSTSHENVDWPDPSTASDEPTARR